MKVPEGYRHFHHTPDGDDKPHALSKYCPCRPIVEVFDEERLVVTTHVAFDMRHVVESAIEGVEGVCCQHKGWTVTEIT